MARIPIAREGWPFILGSAALLAVLLLLRMGPAALAALVLTLFVTWFFRDPEREGPSDDSLLLSGGDGKVIEIMPLPDGGTKVGVFLSVFDVHVNRVPVSGRVAGVDYRKGRFLAAWNTIASDENERCGVVIDHPRGPVRVVQVAGLIARRIICRLEEGDDVARGGRYGLIRFGSRVDLYLPAAAEVTVKIGDRVKGGESAVARWT
jgi:phosphatidylserine decarboxylase